MSYFAHTEPGALESATGWIVQLLSGSVAIAFCVLAVALVGMLLLFGRLHIGRGLRVVLGCFVLLGAPVIAAGLVGAWPGRSTPAPMPMSTVEFTEQRAPPPVADYDPYAGASLRRD